MLLACFTSWIWLRVVLVVKFEQFNYLVGLDKSLWSSLKFIFILQILLFFFFDKQLPSHQYGIYVLCICMTHVWLQIKRLMLMSSLSQGILLHRASSSWYWTPVWCNWGKQHNILQGKQGGAACQGKIGSLPGSIEQDGSFQWVEVARGVQKTLDWQDKRMATN